MVAYALSVDAGAPGGGPPGGGGPPPGTGPPPQAQTFTLVINQGVNLTFGDFSGGLNAHQVAGTTQLTVNTNSFSWRVVAKVTWDQANYLSGSGIEVKTNDTRGWVALDALGPIDITGLMTQNGTTVLTVLYRITTGWNSPPQTYSLYVEYTAEPFT